MKVKHYVKFKYRRKRDRDFFLKFFHCFYFSNELELSTIRHLILFEFLLKTRLPRKKICRDIVLLLEVNFAKI